MSRRLILQLNSGVIVNCHAGGKRSSSRFNDGTVSGVFHWFRSVQLPANPRSQADQYVACSAPCCPTLKPKPPQQSGQLGRSHASSETCLPVRVATARAQPQCVLCSGAMTVDLNCPTRRLCRLAHISMASGRRTQQADAHALPWDHLAHVTHFTR